MSQYLARFALMIQFYLMIGWFVVPLFFISSNILFQKEAIPSAIQPRSQ